jgi:hypothetical protein
MRLNPTAVERANLHALTTPINDPAETAARADRERRRQRERSRLRPAERLTAFRIAHGLPDTSSAKEVTALMRAERSPCL